MICRIVLIALTVLQITGLTAGLCGDDPCTGCGGTTTSCCPTTVDGFNPGLTTADYPAWIQTLQSTAAANGGAGIPPSTATLCVAYRTTNDATYGNSLCLLCRGPDPASGDPRLQGQCCGFPLSSYTLLPGPGEYLILADPDTPATPLPPSPTDSELRLEYYLAPYDATANTNNGGYTKIGDNSDPQYISNQCDGTVDPNNQGNLQTPTHEGFVIKDWCAGNIQETLDAATQYTVDGNTDVLGILYNYV